MSAPGYLPQIQHLVLPTLKMVSEGRNYPDSFFSEGSVDIGIGNKLQTILFELENCEFFLRHVV